MCGPDQIWIKCHPIMFFTRTLSPGSTRHVSSLSSAGSVQFCDPVKDTWDTSLQYSLKRSLITCNSPPIH
uniref:Uncharacterized protein n=1 Tax=Anguilla anguilla TaxID=7936 RepID=A0A0E9WNB8_ANGAN